MKEKFHSRVQGNLVYSYTVQCEPLGEVKGLRAWNSASRLFIGKAVISPVGIQTRTHVVNPLFLKVLIADRPILFSNCCVSSKFLSV